MMLTPPTPDWRVTLVRIAGTSAYALGVADANVTRTNDIRPLVCWVSPVESITADDIENAFRIAALPTLIEAMYAVSSAYIAARVPMEGQTTSQKDLEDSLDSAIKKLTQAMWHADNPPEKLELLQLWASGSLAAAVEDFKKRRGE